MSVSCLTNNLFPCDTKPTSFIATGALVVEIASLILLGVAIYLEWGTAAIGSLSGGAGVAALVAFAIIVCKQPSLEERVQDAGRRSRDPTPAGRVRAFHNEESRDLCKELYQLIKAGDIEGFRKALGTGPIGSFGFFFENHVFLDADDATTIFTNVRTDIGYSLFEIIISKKDIGMKGQFLQAALEKMPDHDIDLYSKEDIDEILKIESEELIRLIFAKLTPEAVRNVINRALDPDVQPNNRHWVTRFLVHWDDDKTLSEVYKFDVLIDIIVASKLDKKISLIRNVVARKEGCDVSSLKVDRAIEQLEIERVRIIKNSPFRQNNSATLMHLAIDSGDEELVRDLTEYKILVEKPLRFGDSEMPPLHHAVLLNNIKIVEILIAADVQLYTSLTGEGKKLICDTKRVNTELKELTSARIAMGMGYDDIFDALMKAVDSKQRK